MIKKDIKYLIVSDLHFGHKRNTTREIVDNLDIYFDQYRKTSQFVDLDIIFIAGDMFDTLLDCAGEDIHIVCVWLSRLMKFCETHMISLRILEGTPSHDWKQSRIAETIAQARLSCIDLKYIDTLQIEHHEYTGLTILYIPDEWTADTDTTFKQVQAALKDNNLEQVDIAILHGLFQYQLGTAPATLQKHSEANYLSIVKYYINIGHIHTFSTYERILAQGSWDRISHGEEEPKGGILCILSETNGNSFHFIENVNAKTFMTITIKNHTLEAAMLKIDKVMSKVRDNSYIRIKAMKDHPIYVGFDQLKLRYPMCYFTKSALDSDEETNELISANVVTDVDYRPISLTKENIKGLLTDQILAKHHLNDKQMLILDSILN